MSRTLSHFRDFLPSRLREKVDEEGPVPLFSPTQQATKNGAQTLLHSIFSPSHGDDNVFCDKENQVPTSLPPPRSVKRPSVPVSVHKTPAKLNRSIQMTGVTLDPVDQSVSLLGYTPSPSVRGAVNKSNSFYFSPGLTEVGMNSTSIGTPFSRVTSSTKMIGSVVSPIRNSSLPAEAFSLDYIIHCDSIDDLQAIITSLTTPDEKKWQGLRRQAMIRIENLRQQPQQTQEELAETPLNYSQVKVYQSSPKKDEKSSVRLESDESQSQSKDPQTTFFEHNVEQAEKEATPCRQVMALKRQENATMRQTEDRFESLQQMNASLANEVEELKDILDSFHEENGRLRENLQKEQTNSFYLTTNFKETEELLTQKVKLLTAELSNNQIRVSGVDRKMSELTQLLRSAQRNLDGAKKERDVLLSIIVEVLGEKDIDVRKISKQERKDLVRQFVAQWNANKAALQAMAETVNSAEKDRRDAIKMHRELQRQFQAANKYTERLERDNLSLTKNIEELWNEVTASKNREENAIRAIQSSSVEKWAKQEQEYKAVIRGLKAKVRDSDPTVPIGVYKSALAAVDKETAKASDYQRQVKSLTSRIRGLERSAGSHHQAKRFLQFTENSQSPQKPHQADQPTTKPKPPPRRLRRVSFVDVNMTENITPPKNVNHPGISRYHGNPPPKTPPSNQGKQSIFAQTTPKTAERAKIRALRVKAAGGRKALERQLKQVRSPKLVSAES